MSKRYYCSVCGTELVHSRKAVPGRGIILDLIDPHECEGYAIKSPDPKHPSVKDLLEKLKPLGEVKKVTGGEEEIPRTNIFNFKDNRDGIRTTAPKSLLNHISESNPEPE